MRGKRPDRIKGDLRIGRISTMSVTLVLLLSGLPVKSEAQESNMTIDKLQRLCAGYFKFPNDPDAGAPCMFYIEGITDGFLHAGYIGRSICPPRNIRLPSLIHSIFDDFNADHPPKDGQAPTFVFRALMRTYPCAR
jgi:hypothetical protein